MTDPDVPHDQLQRRPTQWYDCPSVQRDLLLAIITHKRFQECPHGLALREWLDARYPRELPQSSVVVNLDELADVGLIDRSPVSEHRTAYRLTAQSRACLAVHGQFIDALELPDLAPNVL
jgi:hypothetical protein